MVYDMYLFQVKKPDESKGRGTIYKQLATIPGDRGLPSLAESGCPSPSDSPGRGRRRGCASALAGELLKVVRRAIRGGQPALSHLRSSVLASGARPVRPSRITLIDAADPTDVRSDDGRSPPILSARGLTKEFRGFAAVKDVDPRRPRGLDPRADRPERRRQDHGLQPAHQVPQADARARSSFAARTSPACSPRTSRGSGSCARSRSRRCFRT